MPEKRHHRQIRREPCSINGSNSAQVWLGSGHALDDLLWEDDDELVTAAPTASPAEHESGAADASAADEADLARLRGIFEASEWADLQPIEVETEITSPSRRSRASRA